MSDPWIGLPGALTGKVGDFVSGVVEDPAHRVRPPTEGAGATVLPRGLRREHPSEGTPI